MINFYRYEWFWIYFYEIFKISIYIQNHLMLHNSLDIIRLMCLLNNSSLWRLIVCLGTFYNLKWQGHVSRWMSCVKNVHVLPCVFWHICLLCVVLTFVWTKYDNVLFVSGICKNILLITLIKNVTTTSKGDLTCPQVPC
jgi:lipid-A-disaccharide synthase-like uncharacterized protein